MLLNLFDLKYLWVIKDDYFFIIYMINYILLIDYMQLYIID